MINPKCPHANYDDYLERCRCGYVLTTRELIAIDHGATLELIQRWKRAKAEK